MSGILLYEVDDGVATIVLNRPQVLNALDVDLIRQLRVACERGRDDVAVRCMVLRGSGPAFVAGGDVAMFARELPHIADKVGYLAGELHLAIMAIREATKPVVACVHGAVAGAGISLMAAADLTLAAAGTRFTLAYSRIGTSPDGGATWFLPRLVGMRRALELTLLSDTISADQALKLGLVNRVVEDASLGSECEALARRLAAGPTRAYAETKALINTSFERPLAAHLEAEALAFERCARSADFAEGVGAFVARRAPRFGGH